MDMKTLPIIDPHQHFWDLSMNKHPWLCHETIPFRYGDYAAIRENFLPDDYKFGATDNNLVSSFGATLNSTSTKLATAAR